MKKTLTHILSLVTLLFVWSACAKQEALDSTATISDFSYRFNLADYDSRATMGSNSVEYEAGDQLGFFVGSTKNAQAAVNINTTPVSVNIKTEQALSAGSTLYAYHPYQAGNSQQSASTVSLSIPTTQTQSGNVFDADAMPMVSLPYSITTTLQGGSTQPVGNLYMCNLGAIAEFVIYGAEYSNEKILSLSFFADGGIGGGFSFNLSSVTNNATSLQLPTLQETQIKTVLNTALKVGSTASNAAKIYMILAPGSHKGTITVTTDKSTYTYTPDFDIEFNRSKVRPIELNLAKAQRASEDLITIIKNAGYNPDDYIPLDINYFDFAYYQSNTDYISTLRTVESDGWNGTISDYIATPIFSKGDIPNGSLIVQRSGQQHRPEGWVSLATKNSSRPDNVTNNITVVNDSWWGSYNYRGFNICYNPRIDLAASENATETLCSQLYDGFGIFIPKKQSAPKKIIKILCIGNSFSVDASQYLYGILSDVGYDDITIGNLYIGGCTLETHAGHFQNDNASYTYYLNTTGTWESIASYKPLSALKSQNWDYITMQQGSPKSGLPDTYDPYLSTLINIVKKHQPDAKLIWHMTWAYQADCTHSGFANYSKNQMTMYNAILNTVKSKILTNSHFVGVIPNGTAVQNLRTSYMGDHLTRDGYHMSYDKGRYLTGLTFAKALTGCDLSLVKYTPSEHTYSVKDIAAMKDAANKACAKPYEVTTSAYPADPNFDYSTATPDEILAYEGYDKNKFTKKSLNFTYYAFYNSSNSNCLGEMCTMTDTHGQNTSTLQQFITTPQYTKSDIPVGSIIVIRSGCKYRPEAWVSLTQKNDSSNRPAEVTSNCVAVTDSWWGSWKYRAFNVAYNPRVDLTDSSCKKLTESFAIYVPKN